MFKKLRSKLSQFEEELESELEAQLEAELEAELAGSLEEESEQNVSPSEAAPSAEPVETETPEPETATEVEPSPETAGTTQPSPDLAERAQEEAAYAEADQGIDTEPPADEGETSGAPGTTETQPPVTTDEKRPVEPQAAKKSAPGEKAPEAGPEARPEAAPSHTAPTPEPTKPTQPAKKERMRKPGGPVKKTQEELEDEIAASLEAELGRAVDTQREIEKTVSEPGAGARVRIPADKLDDLLWELELVLLESDVALPVVEAIKNNVREQLSEARVSRRGVHDLVQRVLKTAVRNVLNEPFDFDGTIQRADKPLVIMFVGVNGTGKTTAIAKVTHKLKNDGVSVVMAAGDTFRAGAVQQLQQHADRLGVKMIKHEGKNADPAAVAFDAIEHAKSRHKDVVLLDTAGRMGTNVNLMDEMEKIKRVAQPDLIFFVGDSLAGNDAVAQADKFNEVVGIDGVILTKVDADAKGGAALSVAYAIGKPLVFIGVGQEYEDLVAFDREWMVERLFAEGAEEAAVAA